MKKPDQDVFESASRKSFSLKPFTSTPKTAGLVVQGNVLREGSSLVFSYGIKGDLEQIVLPELGESASAENHIGEAFARKDRLWERTCFEFFLSGDKHHTKDTPYWEFNMSPTGEWNVFSLEGYRKGLQEEQTITRLPFEVYRSNNYLNLTMTLDIRALMAPESVIRVGVSMVVLCASASAQPVESFWAIAHPGPEADFHHPDSFVLSL
ncbi:MAG: DOMON-like domain-containing protein [Cyanobacteria bacterium P01_F01_bin.53]